ncbi:MAG: ABC transporter permease [Prevotellaceae bacterium]|jgi:ABC-type antimicrobial peptide transport system permease subunit|nr:ABC transporter permease [Prevotellaceae bacterium]
MKKIISQYLKTAWYNILHNKGYCIFYFSGTALTFIFVVLVLQLVYIFTRNYPPMTNADRIIRLEFIQGTKENTRYGIYTGNVNALLENLKAFDNISLYHYNHLSIKANERYYPTFTGFINADFWKIYDFDFLYGRPFTKEDCINRKPVIVITESMSQSYFNTKNGVGKKVTFQSREYEVCGVVKNISYYSSPTEENSTAWAPYVFDKFIPHGAPLYIVDVLAPPSMSMSEAKEIVSRAVNYYFDGQNLKVDFSPQKVKTLKELRATTGERDLFQYGGMIALFLFLLIPALNILSLGNANTSNRAEEIAIRRAFGAGRLLSFLQIMSENLLLVVAGSVTGLLLAVNVMNAVQQLITKDSTMENLSIIGHIDYVVIFAGVLPAMLVFSLLSGGLPAYLISKCNIASVLKGGSE